MDISSSMMFSSLGKAYFIEDAQSKNKERKIAMQEIESLQRKLSCLAEGKEIIIANNAIFDAKKALKQAQAKRNKVALSNLSQRKQISREIDDLQANLTLLTPISVSCLFDKLSAAVSSAGIFKPGQTREARQIDEDLVTLRNTCLDDERLLVETEKLSQRIESVFA